MSAYTRPPVAVPVADPLAPFGPAVRAWFEATFEAPTRAQAEGWAAISAGRNTLIHAPTGSGKTLAAFLWCLDRLVGHPRPAPTRQDRGTVRVLYISPLKALTYDVERNLRAPLAGIALAAQRLGQEPPHITIASRTGDTPAGERRNLVVHPPDILVTTPESLYLLLTSQAREILRGVEHVIVDEVHAIAGSKRGAHLALSLERLERLRTAPGPGRRRSIAPPADRPLGHPAAARDHREVPGRDGRGARRRHRGRRHPQAPGAPGRGARGGHGPPRRGAAAGRAARRPGHRRRAALQHLARHPPPDPGAHPRAPQHHRVHQQPPPRGTPRPAPQRAGRRGAGARPSRQHRPRAAPPDRGGAEGRPSPRARRDEQPRAGHRHGRRGPRDPGGEPHLGRPRPPAHRPGRAPGGRALQGRHLPQVPRGPPRDRRGRQGHARRRHRVDDAAAEPARRPRPAGGRDDAGRTVRRWTSCSTPSGAPPRSRRSPGRPSRASSGCSPAPTRPTSSRSSSRGSPGTGWPTPWRRGGMRASSRSPAAARSRIAACSPSSSRARRARRDEGSASWTRRWSTSCAPACTGTSSSWARAPGGSRTSRPTGSRSPPPRGSPASSRSGTATPSGGRWSWAG